MTSPSAGGDDVLRTAAPETGILCQNSSSPQLSPLLLEFEKTRTAKTQSESRKRGKTEVFPWFLSTVNWLFCLLGDCVVSSMTY